MASNAIDFVFTPDIATLIASYYYKSPPDVPAPIWTDRTLMRSGIRFMSIAWKRYRIKYGSLVGPGIMAHDLYITNQHHHMAQWDFVTSLVRAAYCRQDFKKAAATELSYVEIYMIWKSYIDADCSEPFGFSKLLLVDCIRCFNVCSHDSLWDADLYPVNSIMYNTDVCAMCLYCQD
jgi:hypothetical protein